MWMGRGPALTPPALALAALLACGAAAGPAAMTAQEGIDIGEASPGGGVVLLSADARCLGRRDFQVSLRWRIVDASLRERPQRLDISILQHDFDSAPQMFSEAVDPGVEAHEFRGPLSEATVYHWRIHIAPSETTGTASFQTPACPGADFPDE